MLIIQGKLMYILNDVKCYFNFSTWSNRHILHEKYVRIFSFAYNRKIERYYVFIFVSSNK